MPIVITDADAARLLSIPEAIEAMRVAFRDLAEARAVNPPRLRYGIETPDGGRRYTANIHAGAVQSYSVACVRAGSNFTVATNDPQRKALADPDAPNWTIIVLYDLTTGEPLAFMHESYLSGLRVGATSARWRSPRSPARMPRCWASSAQGSRPCRVAGRSVRCARSSACRSSVQIQRTGRHL
jgi:ornithine cyclodeaminase/alanine dehydrogenase-like protein (mu-crystallin family)